MWGNWIGIDTCKNVFIDHVQTTASMSNMWGISDIDLMPFQILTVAILQLWVWSKGKVKVLYCHWLKIWNMHCQGNITLHSINRTAYS